MEDIHIQELELTAKQIIGQLEDFSFYLLAVSSTMIGKIFSYVFKVMVPPGWVTFIMGT